MNALAPVRQIAGVDVPQTSPTVYVRVEHIFALAGALANAFDLLGLRQLAVTYLNVALDKVVPVEGRTVAQIAIDLTTYATDTAPGGIKLLLANSFGAKPREPRSAGVGQPNGKILSLNATRPVPTRAWRRSQRAKAVCTLAAPTRFRRRFNSWRLHPFLAIIGASGSGKSSLVFAGIVPEMHKVSSSAEIRSQCASCDLGQNQWRHWPRP